MNEIELKPCPFCGSTETLRISYEEICDTYEGFVRCKNCDIVLKTPEVYNNRVEAEVAAIENWNRRAYHEQH